MRYDDPRAALVCELVERLHKEAKLIEKRSPDVMALAKRDGFMIYFLNSLYTSLPDDSMMVDHFPQALEKMIDQLGQDEAMNKLES